ncbi:MAG: crossover junction endodeoxyribonuclease RuvC [Planctomycetota bacterium]
MRESRYRVLGIDPGTRSVGIGVVDRVGNRLVPVHFEVVAPGRMKGDLLARLQVIHDGIRKAIREHEPDVVALEEAFYGKSVQSALRIGEGRGVALLAAAMEGRPVAQYPPATVKKAVTGNGNAGKDQVGRMVGVILSLTEQVPEDAADALAVAVCHLNRS